MNGSIVVCLHCGGAYDLTKTETIARYADCSTFKAPCCGRETDTRPGVGFRRLNAHEQVGERAVVDMHAGTARRIHGR